MAEGLIYNFESDLSSAVDRANKKIEELANTSELASKRINTALGMIGKKGIDTSAVKSASEQLTSLVKKIESIKELSDNTTNNVFLKNLQRDGSLAVDEINRIILALDVVRMANSNANITPLSKLRDEYEKLDKQFREGGETTKGAGGDVFTAFSNKKMQEIIDERAALKELIDIRERSTKQMIEASEKAVLEEKRIRDKASKEAINDYKKIAREKRELNERENSTYQGALRFSESASTLNRQKTAVRYLEAARSAINVEESGSIERINKLTAEIERHKRHIEALTRSEKAKEADYQKKKKANMAQMAAEVDAEDWGEDYARWAQTASKNYDRFLREKEEADKEYLQKKYEETVREQQKELENATRNLGRERSAREKELEANYNYVNNLERKQAAEMERISKENKRESISDYKRALSELSALNAEQKKVEGTISKYGKSEKTERSEAEILRRYSELMDKKKSIEAIGYGEIEELRLKFDREQHVKELEEFKRAQDKKKDEIKKKNEEAVRDYKRVINEINATQESLKFVDESKKKYGSDYSAGEEENKLLERLRVLNERRVNLERDFQNVLLKEKNSFANKQTRQAVKDAAKEARAVKEAREREEAKYLQTYEGAVTFSQMASSINEEKEAVKHLTAARDNLSKSTKNYGEIIKELNNRINSHRISIESKTKTQEQEQTLLPSVRNEYARMLREIDSLSESYSKLKKAESDSGADLSKEKDAILTRWKELAIAKYNLEKNSQGQLDEVARKHAAERAKIELNAFLESERKKAEANEKLKKEFENDRRRAEADYKSSYSGAMESSLNAKTAKEEEEAVKNLKSARDNLSESTEKYKEKVETLNALIRRHEKRLEIVREKMNNVHSSSRRLMDISGQLARKLALVFSVSQITGYVKTLASVRGEFELQQKALQAIIKNKDEADKLWNKTVELAVKSPFRVKELVTYTKQLAAYRLETDKLYETNKRLADISAGLGVDMNRLILAYGQVKAANYLRGTELRQFSEAGINVLEELAKYFSEIEGRAIHVGDVFQMVSKRMVSFADVEEVFRRITNEGGTFYNMQEIQSETLKGQLSNLRDSLDIMLNKIGSSNEGIIKGAVSDVRTLVEGWREVALLLELIVPAMLTFNATTMVYNKGIREAGASTLWCSKKLTTLNNVFVKEAASLEKATSKALDISKSRRFFIRAVAKMQAVWIGFSNIVKAYAPFLIVAAVAEAIRRLTKDMREQKRIREEYKAVVLEGVGSLQKEIEGYENLVSRLKEANEGSKERKEIIGKINSQYGEYLGFVVDEKTNIKELADAYDIVIKRMREKSALNSFQKGQDVIEENYRKDLQPAKDEFSMDLQRFIRIDKKDPLIPGYVMEATKKDVDNIYNIIQSRITKLDKNKLESFKTSKKQIELLNSILKGYYGRDDIFADIPHSIELIDILIKKREEEKRLAETNRALYTEPVKSKEASEALEALTEKYRKLREEKEKAGNKELKEANMLEATEEEKDRYLKYYKKRELRKLKLQEEQEILDIKVKFNIIDEKELSNQDKRLKEWAKSTASSVNEAIKKLPYPEMDVYDFYIHEEDLTTKSILDYQKDIQTGWETQNGIIHEQMRLKADGLNIDEKILFNAVRLEKIYRDIANQLGIAIKYEEPINKTILENINSKLDPELQIDLEEALSSQSKLLEEAAQAMAKEKKEYEMLVNSKANGIKIEQSLIDKEKEEYEKAKEKWLYLGGKEDEGKNRKRRSEDIFIERLRIIKEMIDAYEELREKFSKPVSYKGAIEKYKDAFKEAYKGTGLTVEKFDFTTEKGIRAFYNDVYKLAKKERDKVRVRLSEGEYIFKTEVEFKQEKDEQLKSEIEDMFNDYQVSLDIEPLGLPKDISRELFGLDAMSLDELRKNVSSRADEFIGTDMEDEYKNYLKRIDEMEEEAQKERLKKYSKYLVDAQSERVKIKIEELKKIQEVEESEAFNEEQKFHIVNQIKEQSAKDTNKAIFEEFKNSGLYSYMFEDIERMGNKTLNMLYEKLEELKTRLTFLSPEQYKEITSLIEKIEEAKIEKTPFKELRKYTKDANSIGKSRDDIQKELELEQSKKDAVDEELYYVNLIISSRRGEIELSEEQLANAREIVKVNIDDVNSLDKRRSLLELLAKDKKSEIRKLLQEIGIYDNIEKSIVKCKDVTRAWIDSIKKLLSSVDSLLEAFGVAEEDTSRVWVKNTIQIVEMIGQVILLKLALKAMGVEANAALGIIGWIATALEAVAMIFASIFRAKDKSKEKQIKKELEYVNALEKQYKKLEKAIDAAYSANGLRETMRMSEQNIDSQIEARRRMIELEEDKKKTDHDKVQQWYDEIEELRQAQEEIRKEQTEKMGATYDYRSASREFLDAWLEVFRETGDGLDGLETHFQEFAQNLIAEQAVMRGLGKIIEPLMKQITDSIEDDLIISSDEWEKIDAIRKESLGTANQYLKDFYEHFPGLFEDGKDSLTGLQKGIQGITENTAEIIAAYLNSIRFFISDTNMKISRYTESFYNAEESNPIVSQLKLIVKNTAAINQVLESVVKSNHPAGGYGIRVFMD